MSTTELGAVTRSLERVTWRVTAVTLNLRQAIELARKNNAELAALVEDLEQHFGLAPKRLT